MAGRVNLLYLLLLFAFLPALGLLLSVFFMLQPRPLGLSGWLLALPWWPHRWLQQQLFLPTPALRKAWLFYLTQVIALSFGAGGLLAFFILLLGTDVAFVWRSTLIEASDLYPVLRALALPWQFWSGAQPSLELLQQSQDFRQVESQLTAQQLGQWWRYAFAAQCTYNLIPRACLLLGARGYYRRLLRTPASAGLTPSRIDTSVNTVPVQGRMAELVTQVPSPYVVVDWATTPATITSVLSQRLGVPVQVCKADALSPVEAVERVRGDESTRIVVLVKSWEAPLGELLDYLRHLRVSSVQPGLLLPLDWDADRLVAVAPIHLQEWRRFAGEIAHWQVLQLPELTAETFP